MFARSKLKTCDFHLPSGALCAAPALKRSLAGLCRFHARDKKRQGVITCARAEKPRLLQRRSLRAAADRRARQLRAIYVPALFDYPALHLALDNALRAYDQGVMDHRITRVMLRALRIASLAVRAIAIENGATHASVNRDNRDFRLRLLENLELLRLDRKVEIEISARQAELLDPMGAARLLPDQGLPGLVPESVLK